MKKKQKRKERKKKVPKRSKSNQCRLAKILTCKKCCAKIDKKNCGKKPTVRLFTIFSFCTFLNVAIQLGWIVSILCIISHISINRRCVGIITNRAVNNFYVLIVLLHLALSSQYNIFQWKESGTMSLKESNKSVEHYECPKIISKF